MWHAHLARVFTGGTPVPLSQTASVPPGVLTLLIGDVSITSDKTW